MMMMMMIFLLQATAAEGQEKGVCFQIKQSASPPPFYVSAECDAVPSRLPVVVFLWAKYNTAFLAANRLQDGMRGETFYCASPPGPATGGNQSNSQLPL